MDDYLETHFNYNGDGDQNLPIIYGSDSDELRSDNDDAGYPFDDDDEDDDEREDGDNLAQNKGRSRGPQQFDANGQLIKRKRGRPKKERTAEQLAALELERQRKLDPTIPRRPRGRPPKKKLEEVQEPFPLASTSGGIGTSILPITSHGNFTQLPVQILPKPDIPVPQLEEAAKAAQKSVQGSIPQALTSASQLGQKLTKKQQAELKRLEKQRQKEDKIRQKEQEKREKEAAKQAAKEAKTREAAERKQKEDERKKIAADEKTKLADKDKQKSAVTGTNNASKLKTDSTKANAEVSRKPERSTPLLLPIQSGPPRSPSIPPAAKALQQPHQLLAQASNIQPQQPSYTTFPQQSAGTVSFVPTNQFQGRYEKPPYSYPALIAQAIYAAPNRHAPLQHIHTWIPEKYPYFRVPANAQILATAIKQNLAVNRAFINIPLPNGAAYWAIEPEQAKLFDGNTFLPPPSAIPMPYHQLPPPPPPQIQAPLQASPPIPIASTSMSAQLPPNSGSQAVNGTSASPALTPLAHAAPAASSALKSTSTKMTILISHPPSSYTKPNPPSNANPSDAASMTDPDGYPPIAIHEQKMFLSPSVFAALTAQQLSNLQSIDTKQALNILQAFVVNYFKTELKKRKKAEKAARSAMVSLSPAPSATNGVKRMAADDASAAVASKIQKVS